MGLSEGRMFQTEKTADAKSWGRSVFGMLEKQQEASVTGVEREVKASTREIDLPLFFSNRLLNLIAG